MYRPFGKLAGTVKIPVGARVTPVSTPPVRLISTSDCSAVDQEKISFENRFIFPSSHFLILNTSFVATIFLAFTSTVTDCLVVFPSLSVTENSTVYTPEIFESNQPSSLTRTDQVSAPSSLSVADITNVCRFKTSHCIICVPVAVNVG